MCVCLMEGKKNTFLIHFCKENIYIYIFVCLNNSLNSINLHTTNFPKSPSIYPPPYRAISPNNNPRLRT